MGLADLHIHTTASDGRWTIGQILKRAQEQHMSAIAITDHDTVAGLQEISVLGTCSPEVIPGIEFNTNHDGLEIHILGYFIDIRNHALQETLAALRVARENRVKEMVRKLSKLGYALELSDIKILAGTSKALGRPHVASALIKKGYFSALFETGLRQLLAKGGAAYVPHEKLSPAQAIKTVLASGGIPVAAHPGLIGEDACLPSLVEQGLMGLEVYHPRHDKMTTNHYKQLAGNYNLIVTGGSDFHGIPGRYPEDLGQFGIPYRFIQCLNEQRRSRI